MTNQNRPARIDGRVVAALLAVALFLVLATHRNYGGWNDTSRLAMAEAIVEKGRLYVDGTEMGRKSGDVCMIDGHYYSDKPPAVALMAVPVYAGLVALGVTFTSALPRAYYWTTLLTIGLTTWLGLLFLARFLQRVGIDGGWRAITVLGLGLGSLNTAYSVTFSNHPPSATALLVGVLLIWQWRRFDAGLGTLATGGLLASIAATADHGAAFYLPFLFLYVAWPGAPRARAAALTLAIAAAVPLLAYAIYAYALTGSPMPLPLQPRLFEYPGSYFSKAGGMLPGSSLAHPSFGDLLAYAWLCFFGKRGLFSHTPIMLFLVGAMTVIACDRTHPRRLEAALVLVPTCVLVAYYLLTSTDPGGNSYGVRWYCLFMPLCFVFLADTYHRLRRRAARVAFWTAFALSFPLAFIGSLAPWLDPTPYGTGPSWVLVLRSRGWL
jgi:hypothetical protein